MATKGLGQGLSALFDDADFEDDKAAPQTALVSDLCPSPMQPRQFFHQERLEELASSMKSQGVLAPLLVRPSTTGGAAKYEIIAGERRWRAAQLAMLDEVPVVVRPLSDMDAAEIAVLENIQREDLSVFEEAEGYRRLIAQFNYSQNDVAERVGKSRAHVANVLRLLAMPEALRKMVEEGLLSAGHARALLSLENPMPLARQAASENWSVRQLEEAVRRAQAGVTGNEKSKSSAEADKDPDMREAEEATTLALGLGVSIQGSSTKGTVKVGYASLEQLELILERLAAKG